MLNFIQQYILHLSSHTAPLRELLMKKKVFHWDDNKYSIPEAKNTHHQGSEHTLVVLPMRTPSHHPGRCKQTWPGHLLTPEQKTNSFWVEVPDRCCDLVCKYGKGVINYTQAQIY